MTKSKFLPIEGIDGSHPQEFLIVRNAGILLNNEPYAGISCFAPDEFTGCLHGFAGEIVKGCQGV